MKRIIAISLLICLAISMYASHAYAGTVKKAVTGVINTIKTRGQTSTPTPTGGGAVRG